MPPIFEGRPRATHRRGALLGGVLLTFAALAAASPAVALDGTDSRQDVFASPASAPGGVAEGLETSVLNRSLVYADHAQGVGSLAFSTAPAFLAGGAVPDSASGLAVMEGDLYVVELGTGVVRVPWNALTQTWNTAASEVVPGTDDPLFLDDRPVAIATDGQGNLFVGFIRSDRIVMIADPADTAAITQDYAATAGGLGVAGMAYDAAGDTLYLAEAEGVSKLQLTDPRGSSGGTATLLTADIVPAGGIAVDAAGLTWLDDGGTPDSVPVPNLLVGTTTGITQVKLDGSATRRFANGLQNVSGMHLLTDPLTSAGHNMAAGTVLAGEDPTAGAGIGAAETPAGQWVEIAPDDNVADTLPAPAVDPSVAITANNLTTPADLAWSDNDKLFVADHLAGLSEVDLTVSPAVLKPLFDNGIPPEEVGAPPSPLDSAGAVAFDQFGNAYVADNAFGPAASAGVFQIPADPVTRNLLPHQTRLIAEFRNPETDRSLQPDSLAVDEDMNLYVGLARTAGEIVKISDLMSDAPVVQRGWRFTSSGEPAVGLEMDTRNRLMIAEGLTITRINLNNPAALPVEIVDIPVGTGLPTLDAPSDMALRPPTATQPGSLYILDDHEVIEVPVAAGDVTYPPASFQENLASVKLDGLSIAGGLVGDEVGRVRPLAPLNTLGVPRPTLFSATDFAAESTGVIKASQVGIQRTMRSPQLGPVAYPVITTPPGVKVGSLTPQVVVNRPANVSTLTFQLVPAGGGPAIPAGAVSGPFGTGTISGPPIDTTTVPDGDYLLRVTSSLTSSAVTHSFDRAITIDNVVPPLAFTAPAGAYSARTNAVFTVNEDAYVQPDRVRFWVSENGAPLPVNPTRTDTAAPFRFLATFSGAATTVTVKAEIRFSLGRTETVTQSFDIDDVVPVIPAPGIAGPGVLGVTASSGGLPVVQGTLGVESSATDALPGSGIAPSSLALQVRLGNSVANLSPLAVALPAFSASWDTTAPLGAVGGDGVRTIVATGTDAAGNPATSTTDVLVDNVAPDVAISSVVSQTVTVTATNAGLPITGVSLTSNGTAIPGVPVDTQAPYAFNLPPGSWTNLQATATTDVAALTGVSAVLPGPVVVQNQGNGPGLAANTLLGAPRPLLLGTLGLAQATTGAAVTAAGVRGPVAVSFTLARAATVQLVVTSPEGNVVAKLRKVITKKGKVKLVWNGRDGKGRKVKAGVYRIQVIAVGKDGTRKVVTKTIRVR